MGVTNPATLTINDDDRDAGTCPGLYPAGEPNIGQPNGETARIACSVGIIIDLGTSITVDGNSDWDLVYYEGIGVNPVLTFPDRIYLDLVTISIAQADTGPWYPVFIWGDGIDDVNTALMNNVAPTPDYPDAPGPDNAIIQSPPLVGPPGLESGIQIDVDNPPLGTGTPPPNGDYRYVQIYSPAGGNNDGPEVDSLEVLP